MQGFLTKNNRKRTEHVVILKTRLFKSISVLKQLKYIFS